MNLIRSKRKDVVDPWFEFDRIQDEINKLFDIGGFRNYAGLFDRSASPSTDVLETADNYVVVCDLPGVEQKDVELSIANNILTIKGEKRVERARDAKVYKEESWTGSFQRTLSLPTTINAERIEAVMQDGVLRITLPKREEVRPKQITVKVS